MSAGLPYDFADDLELELHVEQLEEDLDPTSPAAHLDGRHLRTALAALERRGIDRDEQRRRAARVTEALRTVPDHDLMFLWVGADGARSMLAAREARRRGLSR